MARVTSHTPPDMAGSAQRQSRVPPPASALVAHGISVSFPSSVGELMVLDDVSIEVHTGEFVALIGPSGCGKSTLFNVIAGLQKPRFGTVAIEGEDVTGKLGHAAYMLQKDLLLPWKSVLDNTYLGLEMRGVSRKKARREAASWFQRFGLKGFEGEYPSALSGGMRQRAALLRTFLTGRSILLLDEPFGALDALTRAQMQGWLLDIWSGSSKSVLLVTHDIDEAIYLADRVYVMSRRPGSIRQSEDVPLPRPRRYQEVVTSPDFAALKRTILQLLAGDA
ncbi:MAG: ABC transporter ATP-binding protein [Chloroflexota bacterium]